MNITRVGYRHNDLYTAYLDAGAPAGVPGKPYLLPDDVLAKLRPACDGAPESRKIKTSPDQTISLDLPLNENDVYLLTIQP